MYCVCRPCNIMRDYLDDSPLKLQRGHAQGGIDRISRSVKTTMVLVVLTIVLLLLDQMGYLIPVRDVLDPALAPVTQHFQRMGVGLSEFWTGTISITQIEALRAENMALQQENSRLKEASIKYEQALIENAHLRTQLQIETQQPWHLLGAEVVVQSPDSARRIIMIARGAEDGVEPGMAVVGQTGSNPPALVGVVDSITQKTATILLITDFGSRVSGRVMHDGVSHLGLVRGQWQQGSRLRLENLERDVTLVLGAPVVTAGLTGRLSIPLPMSGVPADIPIGTIDQVSSDNQLPVAELHPYADPDSVTYVWVILDQEKE